MLTEIFHKSQNVNQFDLDQNAIWHFNIHFDLYLNLFSIIQFDTHNNLVISEEVLYKVDLVAFPKVPFTMTLYLSARITLLALGIAQHPKSPCSSGQQVLPSWHMCSLSLQYTQPTGWSFWSSLCCCCL